MLSKQQILGVAITNATEDEISEYVSRSVQNKQDAYYIVTPNPEMLVLAQSNPTFKLALNDASIALPDGVGVLMAGKLLGKPFQQRITGVDLLENLCKNTINESKKHVRKPASIGFLGGKGSVAEEAVECLMKKYPGLHIVFANDEWNEDGWIVENEDRKLKIEDSNRRWKIESRQREKEDSEMENGKNLSSTIHHLPSNHRHIDILFVAFGFPKQELWMQEHSGKLPVTVMIGVGGAFDYISGRVQRAPKILQNLGLEWLFRLIRQPWRIKRQLALPKFCWLILKE